MFMSNSWKKKFFSVYNMLYVGYANDGKKKKKYYNEDVSFKGR